MMLAVCVFAAAVLAAAVVLYKVSGKRRVPSPRAVYEQGRCVDCGCDCRATPGQCPACGSDLFAQGLAYWRGRFGPR